jgi:hypothetical protein
VTPQLFSQSIHALISLDNTDPSADAPRRVLGRWLGQWQLDHALAAGASGLLILGGGGGAEAVDLRLRAEQTGLKVRQITTPHALAGAVAAGDLLLVLQPQLLPTHDGWQAAIGPAGLIPTFPAATGVQAGFERIDLSRAWAGALAIPGHLLPRLLDLPEDVESGPALLRIALQAGVPEQRMGDDLLAGGAWIQLGRGVPVHLHEEKWLAQRIVPIAGEPVSRRLWGMALRRWGASLPGMPRATAGLIGGSGLLALGGVALGWQGLGAWGFLAIAMAAFGLEGAAVVARLMGCNDRLSRLVPRLHWGVDLAVVACGFFAVEGRWFRRIFPPLVVALGFNLRGGNRPAWLESLHDRTLACFTVFAIGLIASVEVGLMLVAVLALVATLAHRSETKR